MEVPLPTPPITPSSHPTPEDCLTILQILGDEQIRKVRFSTTQPLSSSSSARYYSPENSEELWYQPNEILSFKKQARKLARARSSDCDSMRGLESCTLARQLNRHRSTQCILSAYKKGLKPHETAKVAKICASWSTEIAFVQACHDYCNVYEPTMKCKIPFVSKTPPEFPFALRRSVKTSRSNNIQATPIKKRRVRRRFA